MALQAPTRITIEVHQPDSEATGGAPFVRVVPEGASAPQPVMAAAPREDAPTPAAFDPGECRCLDDEDCNADHAND
jgi:hypothetical protein